MEKEVLEALVQKWTERGTAPECQDGSPDAEVGNARQDGIRKGINSCAFELETLIGILG